MNYHIDIGHNMAFFETRLCDLIKRSRRANRFHSIRVSNIFFLFKILTVRLILSQAKHLRMSDGIIQLNYIVGLTLRRSFHSLTSLLSF